MIPYGRQDIDEDDIRAVVNVLKSDFLTQGPAVAQFEEGVAKHVHAKHAVAVNSATSALHIACLALGVGSRDLVWTVPNTFVASANCARYCGADVDFVDIDPRTWNISVEALRERLMKAQAAGRLPTVVVPVHFAGQPTEQEAIWELGKEFGFRVIEDASHAIGASRRGEPVGSCRWSDITVFSFHPVKIITSGEGGMALTNDDGLAERLAAFRSHGITRDPLRFGNDVTNPPPAWYYEQQSLGYNYRLTDLQAALGTSQLRKLDAYVIRRNALAQRYDAALAGLPVDLPTVDPENISAFHLYVVRVRLAEVSKSHREIFDKLRGAGIGVNLHYMPVHLQPYYRSLGFGAGHCPEGEAHGETAITLPLYATLPEDDQDRVVIALKEALAS
jgi:UDP-4-amino-4,6-dideoxy-N-acetyl-beta-L-altrosamine transaminase